MKTEFPWLPVDTAPKDGSLVLTDQGFALFVVPGHWGSPMPSGWHLADAGGNPICDEDGTYIRLAPRFWSPIPPLPH